MKQDQTTISCPNCQTEIDVNDILYHQVNEQLKQKYQHELTQQQQKFDTQNAELEKQQAVLNEAKAQQDQLVDQQVNALVKQKESALVQKISKQAAEEQQDALALLQTELAEKSNKVKELNKASVQLEALKREKDELEVTYKAQAEKTVTERLSAERQRIQLEEGQKTELKFKELQKQLEDQKRLTEEMKRKQEQGSMQTQGEVQELAIEEWLAEKFPLDVIEEIKKGERGADCLQIVHTRSRQNCGVIYYESKRTKHFQPSWIEKFKRDIQERNANIGVLVTEVMPADMERLGLVEGVWVCSFEEFKGLCTVLRESLIQISTAIVTQESKGDKMGMLYDYLTSNEFKLQIEAIVEGFTQMKADLESEQRSMRMIWKKREKQIDKVLLNTTGMYGSIRGIAGNALQSIAALELQTDDADLLDE